MVIEIDGHYIANVVFIGVTENALPFPFESMLLGHLVTDSYLS